MVVLSPLILFFFFLKDLFIYLLFGCGGSFLHVGCLWFRFVGISLR